MGRLSDVLAVLQYVLLELLTSEASRNRRKGGGSSHWSSWWSALPGVGGLGGGGADGGAAGAATAHDNDPGRCVLLFHLTMEEVRADPAQARIKLRKEWLRLSREHHPDCNPGDAEAAATAQMQKLNHAYEVCCRELDKLEGKAADDEAERKEEEEKEDKEQRQRPAAEGGHPPSGATQPAAGDSFSQRRAAAEEASRQEQRERRRERNAERKEERRLEKLFHQQCREVDEEMRRMQPEARGFAPMPTNNARQRRRTRQRGRNAPPPPEPVRPPPRSSSPPNALLSCGHPLAIAIRLGYETVVRSYLNGELAEALFPQLDRYGYFGVDIPRVWLEVLQHALDAEGNTVLHYISYFERTELLDEYLLQLGPYFSKALLTKNRRGQVPADFCAQANDMAFKERIDTATETACVAQKQESLGYRAFQAL